MHWKWKTDPLEYSTKINGHITCFLFAWRFSSIFLTYHHAKPIRQLKTDTSWTGVKSEIFQLKMIHPLLISNWPILKNSEQLVGLSNLHVSFCDDKASWRKYNLWSCHKFRVNTWHVVRGCLVNKVVASCKTRLWWWPELCSIQNTA